MPQPVEPSPAGGLGIQKKAWFLADSAGGMCHSYQQLRAFAAQHGTICKVYADQESGGKANRTGFNSLLREASQKKFDLVVFWCLDRFSREGAAATLRYLTGLKDHGVRYKSFTEPCLNSLWPFGNISMAMLATIAAQDLL
jgi:DNA invertase Pin-like site-specific DNA recombinase